MRVEVTEWGYSIEYTDENGEEQVYHAGNNQYESSTLSTVNPSSPVAVPLVKLMEMATTTVEGILEEVRSREAEHEEG